MFLRVVSEYKKLNTSAAAQVRFVVIGDGSLRKKLEELSRNLGLTNDVTFAGERMIRSSFIRRSMWLR